MMCITYTNRRGRKFFLRQVQTQAGKLRYVFSSTPGPDCVEEMPEGYEISEAVNGTVSLRKIRSRTIRSEELAVVHQVLSRHDHLRCCKAVDKGKTIVVYEPRNLVGQSFETDGDVLVSKRLLDLQQRSVDYKPTMRFVLSDRKKRIFAVERMCYRSCIDGWLDLHRRGPIEEVADTFLPHLRCESFFELY